MIKTGTMNQRITVQKRGISATKNGRDLEKWVDYYKCWAYVNGLSGAEFWAAQAVQAQKTLSFSVRYSLLAAAINPKDFRLIFNGDVYDITHVDIVRYANDVIKIKAVCVGDSDDV